VKSILIPAALAFAAATGLALPTAQAAGCVKGAVVGGVAGHLAGHHTLLGAAGCAIGHHEASKHARERAAQNQAAGSGQSGSSGNKGDTATAQ